MNAPPDMIEGATVALRAILRARRPDLSWNVREIHPDERTGRSTADGTVRAMLRGDDRNPAKPTALRNPHPADRAA